MDDDWSYLITAIINDSAFVNIIKVNTWKVKVEGERRQMEGLNAAAFL